MTIRIFSPGEKRELACQVFHQLSLDRVDFAGADLRDARFETVSLRGCDFRGADLRGTRFIDCDLREACLAEVALGDNVFERCWLTHASGLSVEQTRVIVHLGGRFVSDGDQPAAGLGAQERR